MTYTEFLEEIAALYAHGLPQKDEWELKYWFRSLNAKRLTAAQVGAAGLRLTQEKEKFWDNDNIPAMIIKMVDQIAAENKTKAHKDRLALESKKDKESRRKAEAMTDKEREENQAKLRELVASIGRGSNGI